MKALITIMGVCLTLVPTLAVCQMDIYANPKNLKVLPEDISPRDLSNTMKDFATGVGVRCATCHVGEAGQPLSSFDFAADDREMKAKARLMIRMVNAINAEHISGLDEVAPSDHGMRVNVRCVTCHRGLRLPQMTDEVLDETLNADGLEAALDKYGELREQYYGTHSFDFEEFMLPFYAQRLAAKKQINEAIAFLKLNAQHFPESSYTYFVLGEASVIAGDYAAAVESYGRAAELDPDMADFLQQKIHSLNAK